jgi:DNA topoisomerase-6 subunit B
MELSKKEKLQVRKDDIRSLVDIACNNVVSSGDYTIGDTAREKITNSLWENMSVIDEEIPKIKKFRSDRDLARSLLKGMNDAKVSRPSNKCLSPITPDQIKKGLEKEYDADFYTSSKRDGGVYKGSPVIVEAGLAYGGQIEEQNKIQLQRYANRVPLVYQKGACSITNTVEDIGWRNYNLKQSGGHGIPKGPVVLVVHVASTNVPFTSESKDAIANVPEIEKIIERAVRDVGRDLKNHINKQNKISKRKEKQNVITEILPEMANKLSEISSKDSPDVSESLSKIMNSVLIETKEDKIIIQNNSNSKEELELRDDNEVLWSGEIKSGEDVTLDKDKDDFEVEGLEEPNYTIKSD